MSIEEITDQLRAKFVTKTDLAKFIRNEEKHIKDALDAGRDPRYALMAQHTLERLAIMTGLVK